MFKLVVLSALFAAVAAEPSVLVASPYTTSYSTVVAPATTSISQSASSVIHPSPLFYSAPWAYSHLIKKRSAQLLAYNYAPTTYFGSYPYATTLLSSPVVHSQAILPAATPLAYTTAHLIKKRSAQLFLAPTTYTAASPLYASHYATAPVISTPLIHSTRIISSPLTYSTHFIKK